MPHRDFPEAARTEKPDITLSALCERLWSERGVKADTSMMSRFFRRLSVTFKKKTLVAREQDRPDISRHRARWRAYQGRIDPRRLVFIDETWTKTNMTRLRGWARKESASSTRLLMAAGRPRLSSPRCATTASMRPACSTGPSTANASAPMSNSSSRRPSSQATSSSSTISVPTRERPCDGRSGAPGRASCSCPNTRPTSIRSSRSSPNSKLCCERPKPEHTTPARPPAPKSWLNTPPKNAPLMSETQDTRKAKCKGSRPLGVDREPVGVDQALGAAPLHHTLEKPAQRVAPRHVIEGMCPLGAAAICRISRPPGGSAGRRGPRAISIEITPGERRFAKNRLTCA
jgi:hypothetical protein